MDVRQLAGRFRSADWTTQFDKNLRTDAPAELGYAECVFLGEQAKLEVCKGRAWRAKNWIALGLYIDTINMIAHCRRVGLFRASKFGFQGNTLLRVVKSIRKTSERLELDSESIRYLDSVRSMLSLSAGALRIYHFVVRQLGKRKLGALKSLVAIVDLMFLKPRPPDRTLDADNPDYYTIEEHAEALSFLFYIFATHFGIEDQQLILTDERGMETGVYEKLLVAGCKLRKFQEAELLVDVFAYSATQVGKTIQLKPEDARLEQSIRLGYIHSELQQTVSWSRLFDDESMTRASLVDLAKRIYEALGTEIVQRRDLPLSRYVLLVPEVDELFEPFRGDGLFREDANYLETVAREQYVPPEALVDFQLAEGLTVLDVVKIRRLLDFLRYLMAQKLLPLMEHDRQMAARSVVPMFDQDELLHLLGQCVSTESAQTFIRIATYDRTQNSGVFDVQYQPLIRGKERYLIPTNVLCSSDLLRNLLYTQRKRVQANDAESPMQNLLAQALRKRFVQVAEGTRCRVDGRVLEIDIVAVVERHLLLIECKSAFHPCGVHELRTSYEHLVKARRQLDRLREALLREEVHVRICQRLGLCASEVDGILTCVVTGNRLFNGYMIGDHPVRPAKEMINMIVGGTIQINQEEMRVWRNREFEPQDLLDYLAGSTLHADLFSAFQEVAHSYSLDGRIMEIGTFSLDIAQYMRTLGDRYERLVKNENS